MTRMGLDSELGSKTSAATRPDWWFAVISAAGAFAVLAASLASWLPVSDTALSHLQIPVSALSATVGGVLAYLGTHRRSRGQ